MVYPDTGLEAIDASVIHVSDDSEVPYLILVSNDLERFSGRLVSWQTYTS